MKETSKASLRRSHDPAFVNHYFVGEGTREDSPWYPTMRLFRKRHGCDWSEVVARIAGHLKMLRADTTCV